MIRVLRNEEIKYKEKDILGIATANKTLYYTYYSEEYEDYVCVELCEDSDRNPWEIRFGTFEEFHKWFVEIDATMIDIEIKIVK